MGMSEFYGTRDEDGDLARLDEAVPRGAVTGARYADMSTIDA
ncbi:MAG: hypothetical protein WBQ50_04640 [Nocardioides sp.]